MKPDVLVYQAKSFYNAYINLEKIYLESNEMMFYMPMLVNGAFSIELTLKAILTKNNIPYKLDHNLTVLFNKLPSDIQQQIWTFMAEKAPEYADTQKATEELLLISNAFIDCRYCFEDRLVPAFDSRFLSAFANAAIYVMFKLGYNVYVVEHEKDKTDKEIEAMFEKNRREYIDKMIQEIDKRS